MVDWVDDFIKDQKRKVRYHYFNLLYFGLSFPFLPLFIVYLQPMKWDGKSKKDLFSHLTPFGAIGSQGGLKLLFVENITILTFFFFFSFSFSHFSVRTWNNQPNTIDAMKEELVQNADGDDTWDEVRLS